MLQSKTDKSGGERVVFDAGLRGGMDAGCNPGLLTMPGTPAAVCQLEHIHRGSLGTTHGPLSSNLRVPFGAANSHSDPRTGAETVMAMLTSSSARCSRAYQG